MLAFQRTLDSTRSIVTERSPFTTLARVLDQQRALAARLAARLDQQHPALRLLDLGETYLSTPAPGGFAL